MSILSLKTFKKNLGISEQRLQGEKLKCVTWGGSFSRHCSGEKECEKEGTGTLDIGWYNKIKQELQIYVVQNKKGQQQKTLKPHNPSPNPPEE